MDHVSVYRSLNNGISFSGSLYGDLTMSNCNVSSCGLAGILLSGYLTGNLTISNCNVSSCGQSGISISANTFSHPSHIILDACTVSNNVQYGIYVNGLSNVTISNSSLNDNGLEGIYLYGTPYYNSYSIEAEITFCEFFKNSGAVNVNQFTICTIESCTIRQTIHSVLLLYNTPTFLRNNLIQDCNSNYYGYYDSYIYASGTTLEVKALCLFYFKTNHHLFIGTGFS